MGQGYKARPVGTDSLVTRLDVLQAQLDSIRTAAGIRNSVVGDGGSMRSADFDGDPVNGNFGTDGWYIGGGSGSGSLAVFNTLDLRDGIIGNDALTNPVVPAVANDTETNFAVPTSFAEMAGVDTIVPDGCTRLLAMASSWVYATNPNVGADNLHCRTSIGATAGQPFVMGVSASGGYTTCPSGLAQIFTGLTPGATIRVKCEAHSDTHSFAANAVNTATVSAILIWLR